MHITLELPYFSSVALLSGLLATQTSAKVWISEFVASNDGSFLDENGDAVD